jgi:hypothetical protein
LFVVSILLVLAKFPLFFGRVAPCSASADAFPLRFVKVRGGSANKTRQPELHRRRKNERGLWVGGYN